MPDTQAITPDKQDTTGRDHLIGTLQPVIETAIDAAAPVTLESLRKQLDHIDTMLHDLYRDMADVKSFIDDHRPALTRALRFLDNPVTRFKRAQAARDV